MQPTRDSDHREALYDASTTIYQQVASLRKGLPIAEAKAKSGFAKVKIRKEYNAKIKASDVQYKAIMAILQDKIRIRQQKETA